MRALGRGAGGRGAWGLASAGLVAACFLCSNTVNVFSDILSLAASTGGLACMCVLLFLPFLGRGTGG